MSSHDQESLQERVWRAAVKYGKLYLQFPDGIRDDPDLENDLSLAMDNLHNLCLDAANSTDMPKVGQ